MQEILDDLFEEDADLEQFCTEILSGKEDEEVPTTSSEATSPSEISRSSAMDSATPDFVLAPEYYTRAESKITMVSLKNSMEGYSALSPKPLSSIPDSDSHNCDNSPPAQQVPSPVASYESEHCGSSPSIGDQYYFDDIKEAECIQSPFIGDDDPLLGAQAWDQLTNISEYFGTELEY